MTIRTVIHAACVAGLGLVTLAIPAALASSDEAWEAFRDDVDSACTALADEMAEDGASVEARVNPFGSERFGAAIVSLSRAGQPDEVMICIYDKQTRAVEMTGPFQDEPPL